MAGEASSSTDLEGRILFSASRAAYVLDPDGPESLDSLPIHEPLFAQSPSSPLLALHRVSSGPSQPSVTHFRVQSYPASPPPDPDTSPVLICFPCKLSFLSGTALEAHAAAPPHSIQLTGHQRYALKSTSAILQSGPTLSFLCPVSEEDLPRSEDENSQDTDISAQELARNLYLASELSASRLLEQVSAGSSLYNGQQNTPSFISMNAHHNTARNSCKTLKCPKCNWHYKYQETLEIHMKEKHPDSETTCIYCLHNRVHPKLARGETYGCGYKPYRCEICKYSTTTKGNLSIHMQSDKHLNNVQELQAGGQLVDPSTLIHRPSPASPARPPSDPSIPSFRCEPCKYETPVARNLRIHMTSDKHAHNMALLGHSYPPSPMPPMSPMVIPGEGEESGSLLDCMVCGAFSSDSLEAVLGHVAADRSQPAPGDISFIAGHHCCHLCQYKTHLKANFHLHTKTDKHLQRLTLVNHLREGGPQNEWKLALISPASSSSLQIRCNSCLDLLTSEQAAVRHCISRGHLVGAGAWKLVHTAELVESRFRCRLCPTQELPVSQMRRHLGSSEHAGALQTLLDEADPDAISPNAVLSISDEGKTGATTPDMGDAIHCCAWCNFTAPSESAIDSHVSTAHGDEERGEGVACPLCQALSLPNTALLETHLFQEHNVPAEGVKRLLSLLPSSNSNVPDSTSSDEPSTPVKCPVCTVSFSSDAELSGHRVESGHVESEEREGVTGFACWACEAFSPSLQAFQSHFRSDHEDLAPSEPGCVSQKHAYSFRCKECSLAFKTCEGLEKHSLYHQMRASTRCAICQRNFRTIPALRRHVEAAHSEPNSAEPASSTDKYRDPNRPFKCQVCRESFTQKNILVVHYNSVSHLHKAKKLMETYGPALPMDPDTLAALARDPDDSPKPAHNGHTPSNNSSAKPYKCNLCNVSYSQSSTLDIHMRSVAHLSKLGKMESGREGPAKEASATQPDDPSALFASLLANPFLAAQFSQLPLHGLFNCTGCGSIFSSPEALATHHSSACPARPERQTLDKIPGAPFKKALQNLGFDLVMQYCESQQQRKRKATEEGEEPKRKRARSEEGTSAHPELGKRECKFCGAEYSSIWVLKAHHEIAHPEQTNVSLEQIETVGEALKDETEPAESEKEEVKPEVKAIKEEPKPTRPESSQRPMDMSSLAGMMNPAAVAAMLGAFNPAALMMPNPFNPFANPFMPMMGGMDFSRSMDWDASGMNELMKMAGLPKTSSQSQLHAQAQAQQSIQNAAALAAQQGQKRARTRITDDQLKILREYFDINNSPTEQQIEEMSRKSGLPLKVIKHWFRNTLFKERQRNKDSPYNFNNAPTMGIDLEEYEKTGEARIIKVDKDGQEQVETAQASSSTTTPQKDKDDKSGDKDDDEEEGKLVIAEKPAPSIHQDRQEKITLTPPKASAEQLSAQETLRRLTAMPGLGNMAYPTSAPNPFSALLLAQTSGMNELMNAGFTSNENLSRPHPTVSESGSSSRLTPNHLPHPGGTGRRANRTRFSDYQLKTLQEFFERQAYPKDDDLEQLSKQLQLSPRVIVVWFQNARQKARKVYENSSAAASTDTGERFTKTPGCNFQCKGCNLVFQRYYELIQHQQKHCFRDSEAAAKPKRGAPISQYHCDLCQVVFSAKHQLDDHLKLHAANPSLKVGSAHHHVEEGNSSEGEGSYCRSRTSTPHDGRAHSKERRTLGFNKRCPFCGILFYSADSMESHLNKRHAEQRATMDVNVHLLPDAEEVPTITTSANYEGNGESSGIGHLSFGSLMRNSPSATESMDMLKRLSEGAGAPLDLSRALKTETEPTLGSRSGSPHMSLGLSVGQSDGDEDGFSYTASPSPQHHSAGSTTPSGFPRPPTKRYRTHLSPMQVSVMKHLFREYKTPSMTECDLLGSAIGLHKRVVQVWFQKAKGRKAKAAQGLDPKLEEFRANQNHCSICSVTYTPKHSLQDHIFTREHIEKVKVILNESGEKRSKLKESRAETALGTNPAAYYAAASGIPNVPGMGMGGFFYDANLLGTPVHLLQIPADVMSRIKAAMREGKTDNCRFTQDGKRLSDLPNSAILTNNDVPLISEKDIDCETVFPSAEGFATHVQMVCGTPAPAFRLTQTHYLCRPCNTHYGRQGKALENDSLGPPPTIPQLRPGESGCEEGAESKGDVTSHAAETAGLHWDANAASNYASAYLPLEKAESSGMLGETDASVYEPASKLFHPSPASSLTSQYYSSAMYGGGGLAYGMGPATGLYGSASPASGSSYYRALKGSAPYAYFPTNTAPAAPNYYGSSYTGQGLDAAYGAAAYTAYGAQAAYGSGYYPGYGSCAPTSPASPTTYTLAQLPPSTAPSLEFPQPNSSPFPKSDPSKKGKSKKKKAPNPSPSPEGDFERVFIWDLDETCILLDSVINGTYAAKFSKDSRMVAQLNSIGIQMEEIVASLAESSFHYGELEECDQVQIEDAAIDDPSQDMGYGNLEGSGNGGLCFAPPPGLRGGVDWMRKLSYRYRRIRDLYALYKDNPEGLLGAKSEAWLSLKTELELLTDKWTPLAKSPLSLIANRAGYVNVVVTSHHLVPAVVKALLFGLAPSIPIENIYSARKVGREAILERVMGRFGKKATYVVVGSGREETGLGRALPHWPVNCHDHLATLTHALDMFL